MNTKRCPKCGQTKNLPEFNKCKTNKDGLQKRCRECQNAYSKAHYGNNSEYYKEKRTRYKRQLRTRVLEYLSDKQCLDCGESDSVVLEFDHREPDEKDFTIATAISESRSIGLIMAEIEKCDIRCANCHRRRTAEQFGWLTLDASWCNWQHG